MSFDKDVGLNTKQVVCNFSVIYSPPWNGYDYWARIEFDRIELTNTGVTFVEEGLMF